MHHSLIVHVFQPPRDVFELLGRPLVSGVPGGRSEGLQVQTNRRRHGT